MGDQIKERTVVRITVDRVADQFVVRGEEVLPQDAPVHAVFGLENFFYMPGWADVPRTPSPSSVRTNLDRRVDFCRHAGCEATELGERLAGIVPASVDHAV